MSIIERKNKKIKTKKLSFGSICTHQRNFRYLTDFLQKIFVDDDGCNCNCTIIIENADDDEEFQHKIPILFTPNLKFKNQNKKYKLYGIRGIYFDTWLLRSYFYKFKYEQIVELSIAIEKHSTNHKYYYNFFQDSCLNKFRNLKLLEIGLFESNVQNCTDIKF